MGGTIELESELGKGSTFRFKLRFEKAAHAAQSPGADTIGVDFTGIHALIVGDGEIGRAVIAQQLAAWKIEALSIASEEAAFSELRRARGHNLNYAVVLLDEGPANKGLNLAHLIKTDAVLKDTRVIVMSSDPGTSHSSDIVDAWLAKPVSPSLLLRALDHLLNRHESDSARAATSETGQHLWRKNIRVLVVEDNLTNQILIKEQLGFLGYTVNIVGDAPGALGAISQSRYDVVCDGFCELPGMNGYEATAEDKGGMREAMHRSR